MRCGRWLGCALMRDDERDGVEERDGCALREVEGGRTVNCSGEVSVAFFFFFFF